LSLPLDCRLFLEETEMFLFFGFLRVWAAYMVAAAA